MKPNISIRPYLSSDLDAAINVFLCAIRELASKDYNAAQVAAWAQADRERWALRLANGKTWIAVCQQQVVGFIRLEPDGYLDLMFVLPDFTRLGIAASLVNRVEKAAIKQGNHSVITDASITAKLFFERQGFSVLKQQQAEIRGEILINFHMQKVLVADNIKS